MDLESACESEAVAMSPPSARAACRHCSQRSKILVETVERSSTASRISKICGVVRICRDSAVFDQNRLDLGDL